jgi:hypothetical protein
LNNVPLCGTVVGECNGNVFVGLFQLQQLGLEDGNSGDKFGNSTVVEIEAVLKRVQIVAKIIVTVILNFAKLIGALTSIT